MTVRLRDERMNRVKANVVIIDEGKETEQFWKDIGGQKPIAPASRSTTKFGARDDCTDCVALEKTKRGRRQRSLSTNFTESVMKVERWR